MLDARITDTKSLESKKFCIEKCPYPECILYITKHETRKIEDEVVKELVRLTEEGMTTSDIAEKLDVSKVTVCKYLKKNKEQEDQEQNK